MADRDVLRALAEEALERGTHPDRESVFRDFVGDRSDDSEPTDEEGQGAGGESKPSTAPETGPTSKRSGK